MWVKSATLFILETFMRYHPPRLRLKMHARRMARRLACKFQLNQIRELEVRDQPVERYYKKLVDCKTFSQNSKWYSQSGQDLFALAMLPHSKNVGTYLEIGSYLPFKNSNTALLEINGWSGISVEKQNEFVHEFNKARRNHAICANALDLEYSSVCKPFDLYFDYCSIDIDPAEQSYFALKRIIESGVKFNTLTFEHDKYRDGPVVQIASYILLKNYGMTRIEKNVKARGFGSFEDWWIRVN